MKYIWGTQVFWVDEVDEEISQLKITIKRLRMLKEGSLSADFYRDGLRNAYKRMNEIKEDYPEKFI